LAGLKTRLYDLHMAGLKTRLYEPANR
jgi:hypothetical protein